MLTSCLLVTDMIIGIITISAFITALLPSFGTARKRNEARRDSASSRRDGNILSMQRDRIRHPLSELGQDGVDRFKYVESSVKWYPYWPAWSVYLGRDSDKATAYPSLHGVGPYCTCGGVDQQTAAERARGC